MTHRVTLVPGDGIGPEITAAALTVLDATGVALEWDRQDVGEVALAAGKPLLPDDVFDSIRATGVALKGPVGTPIGSGHRSVNVTIRRTLDLYACLRPVRSLPGVKTPFADIDLAIVRENTEGLYSGLEHMVTDGVAESLKIITEACSRRIARFAFDYAKRRGIGKVTAVHKANIMKLSDGLFLRCAREVQQDYPDLDYNELIVDNCAMQLVRYPKQFGVLGDVEPLRRHPLGPLRRPGRRARRWFRAPTSATSWRCSSRSTGPRPTSWARAGPTRPRCSSARR